MQFNNLHSEVLFAFHVIILMGFSNSDKVEEYYEIIKEPMDFGTMRAKLHEGMYTSLQQFEVRVPLSVFFVLKLCVFLNYRMYV